MRPERLARLTSAAACSPRANSQRLIDAGPARHDLQPDDLRKSDRQRQRLRRTAARADRAREDRRRALRGARDPRHPAARATCSGRSTNRPSGNDGFVSLEVSPLLAHDTAGTIAAAKAAVGARRPAQRHDQDSRHEGGRPGDRRARSTPGINVNVTLHLLDRDRTKPRRARTSKGSQRRAGRGQADRPHRARSLSVFVSRIDTAVDKLLAERIAKGEQRRARCSARPASPNSS